MEHLIYDMEWRNPRYLANFLDEDFVRRSKRLALKAHPKHVSKHVVSLKLLSTPDQWGLDQKTFI